MSEAKMWRLLYWQTGLQYRQCHAPCTLGKTSRCWPDQCFYDKDLSHRLAKRQGTIYGAIKFCVKIKLSQTFDKYLPPVQYYFTKTLWNLCQIFVKDLSKIWQRFHKVFQQIQFWHILTEWSILGKTRLKSFPADGLTKEASAKLLEFHRF